MIRALVLAIAITGCVAKPDRPPATGVARTWHKRTDPIAPGQRVPGQGTRQRLVYDPRRGHMLLWEGSSVQDAARDVMWELDPATGWKLLCDPCLGAADPAVGAGGRATPALVHDPAGNRIVLFGGLDNGRQERGELWELRGDAWSLVSQEGDAPGKRTENQMVFDPELGALWLIGGYSNSSPVQGDTHLLRGQTWTKVVPGPDIIMSSPGIDSVYDSERARILTFASGNFVSTEMWQHTSTGGWTPFCTSCLDAGRAEVSLVHVPEYDQTFMIGGCAPLSVGFCFEYAVAGTLVLVGDHFETYDAQFPPARLAPGLAYDPSRDVVVMYGGYYSGGSDPDCDSNGNCGGTWELARE